MNAYEVDLWMLHDVNDGLVVSTGTCVGHGDNMKRINESTKNDGA